ncbi:UNVERIFIED_CONTAM: hypothetical protein PYX00_004618 [Menopon gallinae]|uniref:Uncharacterized protein n=1 Tax=Menopon gallinae TaxID=328185 RepID=A0AAW2I5D3_9NEOP
MVTHDPWTREAGRTIDLRNSHQDAPGSWLFYHNHNYLISNIYENSLAAAEARMMNGRRRIVSFFGYGVSVPGSISL